MAEQHFELHIRGLDCPHCTAGLEASLRALPGVKTVQLSMLTARAQVCIDTERIRVEKLCESVRQAGYGCALSHAADTHSQHAGTGSDGTSSNNISNSTGSNKVLWLFGGLGVLMLALVIVGEWAGWLAWLEQRLPAWLWLTALLLVGYPVFRGVWRAGRRKQVTSHTLMTMGVLAALFVGEWTAAFLVVCFMRIAAYTEKLTASQSRRALQDLQALEAQSARIVRDGVETQVPIAAVQPGDVVVVRPGERIPVDGEVLRGQATVNQAALTGEAMPVEVAAGDTVFAASLAQLGSLQLRTLRVGQESSFGRVVRLVEEAERNRADVQQLADKVARYYMPVVLVVAVLTFVLRRDPLATAAVLLVACSCAFAMATPLAMLASIAAAAKRGLLIKGGKYLETLATADVVLVDKTGTLTWGRPHIAAIVPLAEVSQQHVLELAAAAERDSEHPLAEAVRVEAQRQGVQAAVVEDFQAIPGQGVRALLQGQRLAVGSLRSLGDKPLPPEVDALQQAGYTLLFVSLDDCLIGVLAAQDTLRSDAAAALEGLRAMGIETIELLTGDNPAAAAAVAEALKLEYRAHMLPEDKIARVKHYQAQGRKVVMIGDGVNDAPALAQADVGMAMGVAGSAIALEAAHIALLRDDWQLVPEAWRIARRTMRVIRGNLAFTIVFNLLGLSLASLGMLPPIFAAAAQSLPDVGILANSSRLLRPESRQPAPSDSPVIPDLVVPSS